MRNCIASALAALVVLTGVSTAAGGVGMGVIEKSPAQKEAERKEKVKEFYEEGMQALAEGRTQRAVRSLLWAAKSNVDSPYPRKAFDELKKLRDQAARELEVARELISGKEAKEGVKELRRIMVTYAGLGPAKTAGHMLRELENDPKFREALLSYRLAEKLQEAVKLEAEAAAQADLDAAGTANPLDAMEEGDGESESDAEADRKRVDLLTKAWTIYERITEMGPETEPGREAAKALARLKTDTTLVARIERRRQEQKAAGWMSMAATYYQAGRMDLAKDYCLKIIKECPKAPQTERAKAMIESIRQ